MKIRNLLVGALAFVGVFTGCQKEEENLGTPRVTLSVNEMSFDKSAGSQTLEITATRDWWVENDADWVVVTPSEGKASSEGQQVTVTVLENTGKDRTADVAFSIGMMNKYLTVTQPGPGGSAEALIVYYNDYDKVVAEKTYGSGSSWPYLDQFDGWMNQTGSGAANVTYAYSGMSARSNSTSDSNYSDYEGSGDNNMFFGKSAYLATCDIALNGHVDFTMTFGTEKYSQDNGSVFTNSEFHIYLSNDAKKWVELKDYTFAGGSTEGRWNVATAEFSVPNGTSELSICMAVDVASSYRMDDLKLVVADKPASVVDFTKAVEMDFSSGGSSDTPGDKPQSSGKKTVKDFISTADTKNYYELTGTVSGFNSNYCSFDLTDETGEIYVYSVLDASKSEWSDKIKNGGTITILGKYLYYEQKSQHEVVDAYIVSFSEGSDTPGDTPSGKPESLKKVTIKEFLAAEESDNVWYELTGEITSIVSGNEYGNFDIKDSTGEVYIYGMTNGWVGYNNKSFNSIGLKVGDTVTLGTLRGSYKGTPQGGGSSVPAFYISHTPGEGGGNEGGGDQGSPLAHPLTSNITWTLGESSYDATSSGNLAQTATVNGTAVDNLLKLGTGSKTGTATIHVPAGTKKVGFYCVAWKGKSAEVVAKVGGTEVGKCTPKSNDGASGNPPYTLTLTEDDYYELTTNVTADTDVEISTTDPSNGRVIIIGLNSYK